MDNTENMKETKEIIASDNEDMATAKSDIVVSENGGVAPNVSAAAQRLIQSCETSDKLFVKTYSDGIAAIGKIAEGNTEIDQHAINGIKAIVNAAKKTAIVRYISRALTIIGVTGVAAWVYCDQNNKKASMQYIYVDDNDDQEESDEEATDKDGRIAS